MKTEEQETRSEEGERPPSAADLEPREQAPRRRWTAFLTGNAARARREERARRRLRSRQRRYQKSVARRRQRELASLERRLLGRSRTGGRSRSMPFSRPAADETATLETIVTQIVERALEDDRERSKAEVEDAVDMRVRLLAKRLTRRIDEQVERRVAAELAGKRTKSPAPAKRQGSSDRRP
jgi:hypothetical protein